MVYQLCYGPHMNIREDKTFNASIDTSREFEKFTGSGNPVDVIPWLKYIVPSKVSKFMSIVQQNIDQRIRKVRNVSRLLRFICNACLATSMLVPSAPLIKKKTVFGIKPREPFGFEVHRLNHLTT